MDPALDMSLDDIIRNVNSERFRGRGRGFRRGRRLGRPFSGGGGRIPDSNRGGPFRLNVRPSSYNIAQSLHREKNFAWQHEYLDDSLRAAGMPGIENGTKLHVYNLDYGVSNDDIRELFSEIGELRRYAVHFDKNGLPSGSAEVVYARRSDAFAAFRRYNNVQLDGKPMKIEIVGAKSEVPVSARVNVIGGVNGRRTVAMAGMVPRRATRGISRGLGPRFRGGGRGRMSSWGRGLGRGRGRGWGRGRKQPAEKSAEELNKELDTYHAEAMQT